MFDDFAADARCGEACCIFAAPAVLAALLRPRCERDALQVKKRVWHSDGIWGVGVRSLLYVLSLLLVSIFLRDILNMHSGSWLLSGVIGACAGLVTLTSHNIVLTGSKNNQETKLKFHQTFSRCYFIYCSFWLEEFQSQLPRDCRLDHTCLDVKSQFNNEYSIFLVLNLPTGPYKIRYRTADRKFDQFDR